MGNSTSGDAVPMTREEKREKKIKEEGIKLRLDFAEEWRRISRDDRDGMEELLALAKEIQPLSVGDVRMNCVELEDVLDLAKKWVHKFHTFCEELAEEFNGKFEKGERKKEERIVEKAMNDYKGDYGSVLDVERCMILFNRTSDMVNCLQRVQEVTNTPQEKYGTLFSVRRFKDRLNNPIGDGYRDVMVNIQVGEDKRVAFIGEMQITFEGIVAIKEKAHVIYGLDRIEETDEKQPSMPAKHDEISGGKAHAKDNMDDQKGEAVIEDVKDIKNETLLKIGGYDQVNNDDEKKRIEPQACSDVSQVADDAMPARKSCSDSLIPDGTKVLEDSGGLSDDVTVSVNGRRGWTATSSAWAVGLFVIILFVVSRSKVGSSLLVIGGNVKDAKEETLLIIGGHDGHSPLNSVEELNTAMTSWFGFRGASFVSAKSSMQEERYRHGAAVIDGQVYVAGGYNGTSFLGSVERYDPKVGEWILLQGEMNTPRNGCAAAAVDGRLYVMGGWDADDNELDSVEMFDPKTESWSTVASMRSERYGCAAVSLGGKVYVMGGWDGLNALNSGEVFDPTKNEWSPLPTTMNKKRSGCAAAVLGDKIYIAGGYDDRFSRLNGVEVYDPGAGRWSYLPARMHTKRTGCAAAVMEGKLFVAGGYNYSDGYLDSVEVYDPAMERWTLMKMKSKRDRCAAVVV